MRLDRTAALARLRVARIARLATADALGQPHLVPVTFTMSPDDHVLVVAIDQKPKSSTNLRRLRNIAANPRVSVLADAYDEDWTRLWWVRIDGTATIVTDTARRAAPIDWLTAKYPQYRDDAPTGPVIQVGIGAVAGWAFGG